MSADLLAQYDEGRERLRLANEAEAQAKAAYDKAVNARKSEAAEVHRLRSALKRAISGAPPGSDLAPLLALAAPTPPDGILQSLWELLLTIPADGDADMDVFRDRFPLSDGAINGRIAKAKKRGYVETAGWGRYKLTEAGRSLVARSGLRLIGAELPE